MIVTAHQPTYLPGVSVLSKVAAADAVLWLDAVRYTQPGFVNRALLPGERWLSVPVERRSYRDLILDVELGAGDWQEDHAIALRAFYGHSPHFDGAIPEVLLSDAAAPGRKLVDLNLSLIDLLLLGLGLDHVKQIRQSRIPQGGSSISSRLARSVRAIGGTTYLSGPSGRRLLDEAVFEREGIEIEYFNFAGPNPAAVDPLYRRGILPAPARSRAREAVPS